MKPNIYQNIQTPPPQFEIAERPDLGSLMDLYESNYRLIQQLAPGLARLSGDSISMSDDTPDLHLGIMLQGPYTTQFSLTWYFQLDDQRCPEPDFRIRASHDACAAEVVSFQAGGGVVVRSGFGRPTPCHVLSTLDWKWQINIFLKKWLRYCLEYGHEFPSPSVEDQSSSIQVK